MPSVRSIVLGLAAAVAAAPVASAPRPVALTDSSAPVPVPHLKDKWGLGLTWGGIRYDGEYGDRVNMYARGSLRYNPLEWLGIRASGGGGLLWRTKSQGNSAIYDGEVALMFQPAWKSLFRPYVATGVALSSIMISHDTALVREGVWEFREGMRIGYVPVEVGFEWLLSESVSISVMAENWLFASEPDLWDGARTSKNVSSLDFDKRDDIQRVGFGLTFYVDGRPDADRDGVADGLDRCPGTSRSAAVGKDGCPLDTDKDGVADFQDKCPNTPAEAKAGPDGCPLDADKDGVADFRDKCPNTPARAPIDTLGCPLDTDKDGVIDLTDRCPGTRTGAKVGADGCALDNDMDGVLDAQDKCPNTPAGVAVDASGCPADRDHDGVPDVSDRCPNTAAGTEVEADGCPRIVIRKGQNLVLDGIVFKTGSAEIDQVSAPVLQRAAEALVAAPDAKVEIAGFSDNVGSAAVNQKLSQKRAESVRIFLVSLGVPSQQLTSKGYGPSQPVADNTTEEGRARNRRIEFRVQ